MPVRVRTILALMVYFLYAATGCEPPMRRWLEGAFRLMLCERCHKNLATLKYTEVVNGSAHMRDICASCLEDLNGDAESGFEVSGSAPAPRRRPPRETASESVKGSVVCTQCGAPLRDILKTGNIGCPACYTQFAEEIEPILISRHPALRHRGKTPHEQDDRTRLREELRKRRAMLRSALKMESYEEAAVLRDEIQQLEDSLGALAQEQGAS